MRTPRDLTRSSRPRGASLPGNGAAPGLASSLPDRGRAALPPDLLELVGFTRPPWQRDALCREHHDVGWYAARDADEARAICARCLVRGECRDYAIEHHEHGIWGDTDARERTALRRPHAA